MRYGLAATILLFCLTVTCFGQEIRSYSAGDSVLVQDALLQPEPKYSTNYSKHIDNATPAQVVSPEPSGEYIRVTVEGDKGWVNRQSISPIASYRRAQRIKRRMRRKGYTVMLVDQTFSSERGGVNIGLIVSNISESKTVKYANATWRLYNPVGDPVREGVKSATAETRFVGPLEPGETGNSTFENVWRTEVGSCAELKKLVVEHIDGSSFTYVNDLEDIAQLSESVRLEGDCSYEAQQRRKK